MIWLVSWVDYKISRSTSRLMILLGSPLKAYSLEVRISQNTEMWLKIEGILTKFVDLDCAKSQGFLGPVRYFIQRQKILAS